MSLLVRVLFVLGILLTLFGWWGRSSVSGRTMFDEMAGIIPEACFYLGPVVIFVATVVFFFRNRR